MRECREGADSDASAGDLTECGMGTAFLSRMLDHPDLTPGCCERGNVMPEAEAQVLNFLLVRPGGNCELLDTCNLAHSIGIPGQQESYDPTRAPADDDEWPHNQSTGTGVDVSFMITSMNDPTLDSKSMRLEMYFKLRWNDPRLRWNVSNFTNDELPYGLVQVSHVNPDTIWKPDFFFTRMFTSPGRVLTEIYSNGDVYMAHHFKGGADGTTLHCDSNLFWYPFDNPVCWTDLQSFGYQTQVLQFARGYLPNGKPAVEVPVSLELGAYIVQKITMVNVVIKDRSGDWTQTQGSMEEEGSYADLPGVILALYLSRDVGSSIYNNVLFPIFAAELGLLTTFMDPNAVPARAGAMTVLLLVQFNTINSIQTKKPAHTITLLDIYLLLCILTSACNFLEFLVVNFSTTKLREEKAHLDAAAKRSVAEVFYYAMVGLGVDKHGIRRGMARLKTQDALDACLSEFGERFKFFYHGDLFLALRKELDKSTMSYWMNVLHERGIQVPVPQDSLAPLKNAEDEGAEDAPADVPQGESSPRPSLMSQIPIPDDADKAWSGGDIWRHVCRAAALDSIVGEDLLELSFSNVSELTKSYGIQSPVMKVKLEMEFIRLQKLRREQKEVQLDFKVKHQEEIEVIEITIFGCLRVQEGFPSRFEQRYRKIMIPLFQLITIVWLVVGTYPHLALDLSTFCSGGETGCCLRDDPDCSL